ncbi:MAG: hypothetical protein GF388_00410, partial [Candidatus Aegiribacteria sp.]|nr:hypothetical protein [Candidatus Aegiribacteria sp.]
MNPFDYFIPGELDGYDSVGFKNVYAEQDYSWFVFTQDSTNKGVFFLPDGVVYAYIYGSTLGDNAETFQDIIFGKVDIAAAPYSSLPDFPDNSGSGVQSIGYEIFRQNPLNSGWFTTESALGNWGYRVLFNAEDQIGQPGTGDWNDIYYRLFFNLDYFENNYIITNTGAIDPSDWNHGWDNVWFDDTEDNWFDGICRGAWNTRLAKWEVSGSNPCSAVQNKEAFFPDGRYAIDITARSHASPDTDSLTMRLPVEDLSDPESPVEGIIVDNFRPRIDTVIVYSMNPEPKLYYFSCLYAENYENHSAYQYSSVTGYFPTAEDSIEEDLFVAVQYSEHMQPGSNDVHIVSEMGGSKTWESSRWGYFDPVTITPRNWLYGEDLPETDNGHWVLYKMETWPWAMMMQHYSGRIHLLIGSIDLAGSIVDSEPTTIAHARDLITGSWDDTYYEPGADEYSWGEPDWDLQTIGSNKYYIAEVADEQVFMIDVDSIHTHVLDRNQFSYENIPTDVLCTYDDDTVSSNGFERGLIYSCEPCPYYCGIWAIVWWNTHPQHPYLIRDFYVAVVQPVPDDPIVVPEVTIWDDWHALNATYWGGNYQLMNSARWFFGHDEDNIPAGVEWANQYFWFRNRQGYWGNPWLDYSDHHGFSSMNRSETDTEQWGPSTEQWICIDAISQEYYTTYL